MKQIMRALPVLTLALLLSGCAAVPAESPEPTAVPTAESLPAEETAAPTPAESPAAAAVPEIVDADDLRQLVVDYLAPLGVLHLSTPSSRSTWR